MTCCAEHCQADDIEGQGLPNSLGSPAMEARPSTSKPNPTKNAVTM
jgi:hypothetical protein